MSETKWRECADPEVPAGWSPDVPPADDLRERIARAAAGGYMRVPIVALDGMYLGPPWIDVADAVLAVLPEPPVPPWPDGVLRDAANRLRWIANSGYIEDPGIKRIIRSWADELDAIPVPPWPGAVLSGCVDEDGVPTWLAQAGQVRGEQVRFGPHGAWWPNTVDDFDPDNDFVEDRWVEVRAPRAVPEPETERVPWWEARDRLGLAGDPFVEVGSDDEGPWVRVVEGGTKLHSPVAPDGTVEVLKDGDR